MMNFGKISINLIPRIMLKGLILLTLCAFAVTNANAQSFGGAFEGMSNSKEPIQIEADKLEVIDTKGIAKFVGNVSVVQGTTLLKAKKLKVHYLRDGAKSTAGGNVKKIEATGKVAVRSGDQHASADSATVNMQSQIAILSGNVTVSQGANVVVGCKLVINMKTNAAKLTPCASANSGRVKMVFTPESN